MIKPGIRGWFKRSFNEPYQARKLYNELTNVSYTGFDDINREPTGVPIGRNARLTKPFSRRTLTRKVPVVSETEETSD